VGNYITVRQKGRLGLPHSPTPQPPATDKHGVIKFRWMSPSKG